MSIPAAAANRAASDTAYQQPNTIALRASLALIPLPSGPMCSIGELNDSITGRASSTVSSSPPTRATIDPSSIAGPPPVTPQSSRPIPASEACSAAHSTVAAVTVLSTTIESGAGSADSTPYSPPSASRTWASS